MLGTKLKDIRMLYLLLFLAGYDCYCLHIQVWIRMIWIPLIFTDDQRCSRLKLNPGGLSRYSLFCADGTFNPFHSLTNPGVKPLLNQAQEIGLMPHIWFQGR